MNQAELNELIKQHMEWTQSKGASGKQLNLEGVSLKSLEFKDIIIMNARFSDVCFAATRFNKVILRNCRFDSCDFSFSEFVDSFVSNNKIQYCIFALSLVHDSSFLDNELESDLFEKVIFSGSSRFKDNDLKLVSFDGTEFIKYNSKYAENTQLEEIYRKSIERSNKLIDEIQNILEEGENPNMSAQSAAQDLADELRDIGKKIEKSKMPSNIKERAMKELKKLTQLPPMSGEFSMQRTYLDNIIAVPWGEFSEVKRDMAYAARVLDQDHYGLEKVKERVLEYLAVNSYKKEGGSGPTILCLQGPPGIGKTFLTASIAKATGRELVSIALGGVSDEAEIRGHRRTYIGAMSGKIVNALKKVGKMNPVILLDEIDKLGSQHKGDPSAALLEVLDPSQNHKFNDHYLDMDLDLSNIMFVCTSNYINNVPAPLRDRMEIIHLTGYTEREKVKIATSHLARKAFKQNGLESAKLTLSEEAALELVRYHTREAGVRTLEKTISSVCRKIVKSALDGNKDIVTGHGRNLGFKGAAPGSRKVITKELVSKLLGDRKYEDELASEKNEVGYSQGLAYTSVGGAFLPIEVLPINSRVGGTYKITGQLGDVMKEATNVAFTYVKRLAEDLGKKYEDYINSKEFHIHFPDTACPKDGPSAGLITVTAIFSAVTGIPFDRFACGTGEVDLRGNALPIGGVKEKMFAAYTAGAKKAFLPKANEKEIKEVSPEVLSALEIKIVKRVEEVLLMCLDFDAVEHGASVRTVLEQKLGLKPINPVTTLSV